MEKLTVNRTFNFEIYPDDLGEMNWDEAKKACEELGDGWRLPTYQELQLMKDALNGGRRYWSLWDANDSAAPMLFSEEQFFHITYHSKSTNYVRAIRDINH